MDRLGDDGGYKNSGYHFISDQKLIELSDSLLTMWSLNADDYPNKPWYPWAQCTDEDGEFIPVEIHCSLLMMMQTFIILRNYFWIIPMI